MSLVNLPKHFEAWPLDALVLTQTQRMAMHTLESIASSKRQHHTVWQSLSVRAYNYWLEQVWQLEKSFTDYADKVLLTPYQEQLLWKRVLRESNFDGVIVNYTQTAKQVALAYKQVHSYGFTLEAFKNDNHPDCRAYHEWHQAFNAVCVAEGYVPSCWLPKVITSWVESGVLKAPSQVVLLAFDEVVPSMKALLKALERQGSTVQSCLPDHMKSTTELLQYESVNDELHATVDGVLDALTQGDERVGIIAPDMTKYNENLIELLNERLEGLAIEPVIKSSVPEHLISKHLVSVASKIISLPHSQRPFEEWNAWLRSGVIQLGSEGDRHILCELLERTGRETFGQVEVVAIVEGYQKRADAEDFCSELLAGLSALEFIEVEDTANPAGWVTYWLKLLEVMGWCKAPLSESDLDVYNAFMAALQSFASLGLIEGQMTRYQALQFYRSYIAQQVFHVPSRDPNVYLLSAFEGSSLAFDTVYAIGFSDQAWPQAAAPNPFVPMNLQRDHLVPHSSSERELHYAKLVTQRFLSGSKRVVLSYAAVDDGVEQVLSPLLDQSQVINASPVKQSSTDPIPVQWLEDSRTRPLAQGERSFGGTYALKDHSSCPFKSYGLHRLGLKSYNKVAPGLSYQARGNLLHYAMETFWNEYRDRKGLEKLFKSGALDDVLKEHTQRAFQKVTKYSQSIRGTRFAQLEVARIMNLMEQWLKLELQRPEFSVRAVEQQVQLTIGGLRLSMVIDRVDQLEAGGKVIIDYKTGKCSVNDWTGSRIGDPQLPLNTIALDEVVGVAFAKLQAKSVEFHGITISESTLPGVNALHNQSRLKLPKNWAQLLEFWRESLDALADDFAQGNAAVEPRAYDSCTHCHLAPVCRINDHQRIA